MGNPSCPPKEARFGLYVCVGLKMGVGEPVRLPYNPPGGVFLEGSGGGWLDGELGCGKEVRLRAGEAGGDSKTSSLSGKFAWRRSRVPKFLT